jgi:hypothetical protein
MQDTDNKDECNGTRQDAKRPVERLVMRNCASCKHYTKPEDGYSCGRCNYPVPAWLLYGCSGGGFVTEMQGDDCAVYERA